jgi:ABC-type sugar transport system substrate-binding protein
MLSGIEGASPSEKRRAAAQEVFCQHPGITVAALRYTDWREEQGREITHRLVEEHGVPDGVWCDSGLQGAGSMQAFLDCGMPGAKIPPHTGGDVNHVFQLAVLHRVALAAVEYPASMGARAVQAALDVLAGKIMPRHIEVHAPVVVARGCETPSVHADVFADDYVRWDRPAEYVASLDCSS